MKPQGTQNQIDQPSIPANDQHQPKEEEVSHSQDNLSPLEIKDHTAKTTTLEGHLMETYTEQTLSPVNQGYQMQEDFSMELYISEEQNLKNIRTKRRRAKGSELKLNEAEGSRKRSAAAEKCTPNAADMCTGNLRQACDENGGDLEGLRLGCFRASKSRHFRGNGSCLTLLSDYF